MDETSEINPSEPGDLSHNNLPGSYSFAYSAPVLNNTVGTIILGVINIILIFLLARSNHQYKKLLQKYQK